ncbi:MAG TPA: GntR family transcriptional regulator [Acidimicrobiia bacterium]|jgi:DNA-binding GntR family transcriptional regulator
MTDVERFRLENVSTRPGTAVDVVRDVLRVAILRGDLPGGTRLVQTEIANRLGVSTTPVREAMRDLAAEGLVMMDSHRIGTVRTPDWDEMVEIVEIRHALEHVALARAIENIAEDEMEAARALADELAVEEDLGTWMHKNIQFHSILHSATRTRRLGGILASLEEAGGVFVAQSQVLNPEIRSRAVAEHFEILEAVAERDLERAVEIMRGHVKLSIEVSDAQAGTVR